MNKRYFIAFIFLLQMHFKPSTQNITQSTEIAENNLACDIEMKTDSLISDFKELNRISCQKEQAKKELKRLDEKIREKRLIKQVDNFNNKGI